MLPMPPSTAAVKALRPDDEAHLEVDLAVLEAVGDGGDGGERGADGEGDDDDAVGVDAHQLGGVGVLRGGLHGAAGAGLGDEEAEGDHAQRGGDEQEEVAALDDGAEPMSTASPLELREGAGLLGVGVEASRSACWSAMDRPMAVMSGASRGPPRSGR